MAESRDMLEESLADRLGLSVETLKLYQPEENTGEGKSEEDVKLQNETDEYLAYVHRKMLLIREIEDVLKLRNLKLVCGQQDDSEEISFSECDPNSPDRAIGLQEGVDDSFGGFYWSAYPDKPNGRLTSAEQIKNLALALDCCPPTALDVCVFTFHKEKGANYILTIKRSLAKLFHPQKLSRKLSTICTTLNKFLVFILKEYQPKKAIRFDMINLYAELKKYEAILQRLLLDIMKDEDFPVKATMLFVFTANLYLLLLKELAIFDPEVGQCEDSKWTKTLMVFARMCVKHAMTSFTELWRLRADGIAHVTIKSKQLKKTKSPEGKTLYKLTAIWKDGFIQDESLIAATATVQKEQINETNVQLTLAASEGRDNYTQQMCYVLDSLLHSPMQCSSRWLNLTTRPFCRSIESQRVCFRFIHSFLLWGEGTTTDKTKVPIEGTVVPVSQDRTRHRRPQKSLPIEVSVSFKPLPNFGCSFFSQCKGVADTENGPYAACVLNQKGIDNDGTVLIELGSLFPNVSVKGIECINEEVFNLAVENIHIHHTNLCNILRGFNLPSEHLTSMALPQLVPTSSESDPTAATLDKPSAEIASSKDKAEPAKYKHEKRRAD